MISCLIHMIICMLQLNQLTFVAPFICVKTISKQSMAIQNWRLEMTCMYSPQSNCSMLESVEYCSREMFTAVYSIPHVTSKDDPSRLELVRPQSSVRTKLNSITRLKDYCPASMLVRVVLRNCPVQLLKVVTCLNICAYCKHFQVYFWTLSFFYGYYVVCWFYSYFCTS